MSSDPSFHFRLVVTRIALMRAIVFTVVSLAAIGRIEVLGVQAEWAVPAGGSWIVSENWNGGVPSGAGDTAQFGSFSPEQPAQITLDRPVTVGQLIVSNANAITISDSQSFIFDTGDGDSALIDVAPQSGILRFSSPIVLDIDGVNVNTGMGSRVRLSRGLTASPAALFKRGPGTLVLEADNSPWTGILLIESGAVQISRNGALGSESSTVSDGTVVGATGALQITSAGVLSNEHITLRGGALETTFGSRTNSATIAGTVVLEADSFLGSARTTNGLVLSGAIQGPGGITFDGGSARITGDNSYLGPTLVRSGTMIINSSSALGSTPNVGGSTTTIGPGAAVVFDMGWSGLIAPNDRFVLDGGTLEFIGKRTTGQRSATAQVLGNVEVPADRTGTIRIATLPNELTHQQDISLRGVSGQGSLDVRFHVAENAFLDLQRQFTNVTFVDAPVEIGGTLRIGQDVPTPQVDFALSHGVEFSVPVEAGGLWADDGGYVYPTRNSNASPPFTLRFTQPAEFDSIIVDGPLLTVRNVMESHESTLDFRKGVIDASAQGRFVGISQISKTTSARAELRSIADAAGITDINVSAGILDLRRVSQSRATTVRLNRSDYAGLAVTGTFDGSIDLNNALGPPHEAAALFGERDVMGMINGNVYLGDIGSVIGGYRLTVNGNISGGDLDVTGDVTLTGNNTYTGVTTIRGTHAGFANLQVQGSIASSPKIVIADNATLQAGPRALHPASQIVLGGGAFDVRGSGVTGPLSVTPGESAIRFEDNGRITFSSLDHDDGGMVWVVNYNGLLGGESTNDPRLMFQQLPQSSGGILGGWLAVLQPGRIDFAQVDTTSGVTILPEAGRTSQVDGATSSDNVLVTRPLQALTGDTTINSLNVNLTEPGFDRFDLQGNLLTIETGGLLLTDVRSRAFTVANGRLTSGESTLYVGNITTTHSVAIEASIVDNAGPVGVTFSRETSASGENTYTGPTRVLGNHSIRRRDAVPTGGDVTVQGIEASFNLQYPGDLPLELGTLRLLENATVDGGSIRANQYQLQSGRVRTGFIGNGTLHKTGSGAVTFTLAASMRDFSGPVIVDHGTLAAENGNGLLGTGPITINGGRVVLFSEFHRRNEDAPITRVANQITLNGGDLAAGWHGDAFTEGIAKPDPFRFEGPIDVTSDSTILTYAPGFYPFETGAHSGLSDQLPTTVTLANVLSLGDNATLRKLGPGELSIAGPLTVSGSTSIVVEEDSIRVTGDINSNQAAVLDLVRANPTSSWTLDSSIHVSPSASLQLLDNGTPLRIDLSRAKTLGGGGTLENDVWLRAGARVMPGEAVGQIAVNGDLTFSGASDYQWELGDASGTAGAPFGWDLLLATGTIHVDSTDAEPARISIVGRNTNDQGQTVLNFDPQTTYQWLIASAKSIEGFEPGTFLIDSADFVANNPITDEGRFFLRQSGDGLVLRYDPLGRDLVALMPGDANQDLSFDQLDLVRVLVASKYLTGQPATWGEGDWNGGPGGSQGNPPAGDSRFNQLDIIAALGANVYLSGPYGSLRAGGRLGDARTSLVYNTNTGEIAVDAPADVELTSINIDSATGIFTAVPAANLRGSFDNDADTNIFKATFGASFGSLSFGRVARAGLSETFVLNDITIAGSLAGGGGLGNVDLVFVPEPAAAWLAAMALAVLLFRRRLPVRQT